MPEFELPNMTETLGAAYDKANEAPAVEEPAVSDEPIEDSTETVEVAPVEEHEDIAEPAEVAQADEPVAEPAPATNGDQGPETRNDALEAVLAQRREAWKMEGLSEAQAIEQLTAISDFATRDPAQFIQWFAQQRGLDLTSLVPKPESEEDNDEFLDPEYKAIRDEVKALRAEQAERQQFEHQARVAQVQSHITSFAEAKDEAGALKHPHFQQVAVRVGALMHGEGISLEDAYERACWADPNIRQQLMQQAEAARIEKAKAAAAKAEKAARQVRTPGGQFAGTKARTMQETMAEVYDRVNGTA